VKQYEYADLGLTPFTKSAEVVHQTGAHFDECCGVFWPESLYKAKKAPSREARVRLSCVWRCSITPPALH
jgi:hypothetical protein